MSALETAQPAPPRTDADYVMFDRFGIRVERVHCGAGPFTYTAYEVQLGSNYRWCADWSLSKRVEGNTWRQWTWALRCNLCHRFTRGCGAHVFCGLCPQCEAWEAYAG